MAPSLYTAQLGAGLGMVSETRALLELWDEGMSVATLNQIALQSGRFPNMSARRLRNVVAECFAPRFLVNNARPARLLKEIIPLLSSRELEQLLFVFACRANLILADFVREVYWSNYAGGQSHISNEAARDFVIRANQDGKTAAQWSPELVERVAGYLTRCLADFGLLEPGIKKTRRILSFRVEPRVAVSLAYELHFSGHGDNRVVSDADWSLFGMEREDVLEELKRLALKGLFIVQAAGGVTRIGWQCKDVKELAHVLAQS